MPLRDKIGYPTAHPYNAVFRDRTFSTDLFGNIILFIPFAFFLVFVFNIKSFRRIILTALLASISVELIQWIFGIGKADIDDAILNVSGTAIGMLILKLFVTLKLLPSYSQK